MHADELDIDTDLVRRSMREQFPQWAELEIEPHSLASGANDPGFSSGVKSWAQWVVRAMLRR